MFLDENNKEKHLTHKNATNEEIQRLCLVEGTPS